MTNLLIVLLIAVFALHFTSEVFVSNKRLQRLLNNLSILGLSIWFLVAIVGVIVFGA